MRSLSFKSQCCFEFVLSYIVPNFYHEMCLGVGLSKIYEQVWVGKGRSLKFDPKSFKVDEKTHVVGSKNVDQAAFNFQICLFPDSR